MFRRSYGNIPVRRYRIIRTIVAIAIAGIESSGQNQALQIGRLTYFGLQRPKQKIEVTETIQIIIRKSGLRLNRKVQRTRGSFLESPVNFSGPKSNIQIEIERIRARVLASRLLHFVSLTDSFILLDAKLLKPRSLMETETAYRAR